MTRLTNGQFFPHLEMAKVGGGLLILPDDLAGHFGVILIYRGSWCPYCNAQLSAFQRASETLAALDIRVVAFSVDDEQTTQALIAKHHLNFPMGHSARADEVSQAIGAYVNERPHHFQSTGFILKPDSTVLVAVYSSGAVGRLVPEDVAGLIRHIRKPD